MQLAIIGFFIWVSYGVAERRGEQPALAVWLVVGVCVAAIATGIVAKVLDWLARIRSPLSRRVRAEHELTGQNFRLPPGRTRSDSAKQIPGTRIDQNLR